MPTPINTLTGNIPLKLAKNITKLSKKLWDSGEFLELVTPTTAELLKFCFFKPHTDRKINFHQGQKEAILNTIYLHEILKIESVLDIYKECGEELLEKINPDLLSKEKYSFPKYAMKMATGTGKTWVMNALFIWQYLNAREDNSNKRYTKNFLLVAPGLIVYDRLLDSYLGKENKDGSRDVLTSDILKNQELFLPPMYVETIKAFLSNSVVKKEEIGKKITGDGMLAISNWHLFMGKDEDGDEDIFKDPSGIVLDIFPARPGTASGNSLDSLDSNYFSGQEIEYLASLEDLFVMNDEAHHIRENKLAGEIKEVEWQKSLNLISQNKKSFFQVDFSATPFDTTGSGQKRTKHYFPHIITDFDLSRAISGGLVKLITLDKRKELSSIKSKSLDFKAIRDGENNKGKVISLSEGQRLMLGAGLKKLEILEKDFSKFGKDKYPKMLVMCEDTEVVEHVEEYLKNIGLEDDEILSIHSKKKSNKNRELKPDEWEKLKYKLFSVDKRQKPKVIISVLMLREGFDVNNVCVIVPLRSSTAPILLEQTIGRGLRLMWREPEFFEVKRENRERVLKQKKSPQNYLDVLTIIEHPAFNEFYDKLIKEGLVGEDIGELGAGGSSGADMITVGLKKEYKEYDMCWIETIFEEVEEIVPPVIDLEKLSAYTDFKLDTLKSFVDKEEIFYSEEITVKTTFGEYRINSNLFDAKSYNEYLQKLTDQITHALGRVKPKGHTKPLPMIQTYQHIIVGALDRYIKTKLFSKEFDPLKDDNWRVLMLSGKNITQHIIKEFSKAIYDMQNNTVKKYAQINKRYFSSVNKIIMREKYSLDLQKTIYEKTAYPSNKGGFEKDFLEFLDRDSKVEKFIKILEFKHDFATIKYFRDDGLMANYYPDFLVQTKDFIYIVETKAKKDEENTNVKLKQRATLEYIKGINDLKPEQRENREWGYLLVNDEDFYKSKNEGSNIEDIAKRFKKVLIDSLF